MASGTDSHAHGRTLAEQPIPSLSSVLATSAVTGHAQPKPTISGNTSEVSSRDGPTGADGGTGSSSQDGPINKGGVSGPGPSTAKHLGSVAATPELEDEDGFKCSVQTLYEGPSKCHCCKNWVEEYPDDLRETIEEEADVKEKALVVRMAKNHSAGKPLVLDSLVIQSRSLKKTLGKVFEGHTDVTTALAKLVFSSPFHIFYYRWKALEGILERQKSEDPTAAAFTQLLYDVIDNELRDTINEVDDLLQNGVITYRLLWALFNPRSLVTANEDGHQRFYVVTRVVYDDREEQVDVSAKYVDWDGRKFGYVDSCHHIAQFDGTKRIAELDVFPARFHPEEKEERRKAIDRGQKFQKLQGFHYLAHSGVAKCQLLWDWSDRRVNGRIIVDSNAYFEESDARRLRIYPLTSQSLLYKVDVNDDKCREIDTASPSNSLRRNAEETDEENSGLTNEQLLLCGIHLRGYSLELKLWAKFQVEDITDISWNDTAFPNLILHQGLKQLVLSFVEGHANPTFDDVIEGKGQGRVMMLAGNPGTGKTLTAEAVADKLKKPLYILSAGELGSNATQVGRKLGEVLNLTAKWNAVLLLDECDVFIQKRSASEMLQNEIVSVFLRLLEYYRGILIMTTNRADAIDRAVHSRIDLILHYPDLEPAAKEQIWRQFTGRCVGHSLTDKDFRRLSRLPMNGRQIKNVVKVAALLATREEENAGLNADHIRTVLAATREAGADVDFRSSRFKGWSWTTFWKFW
ncbi:hypothetical protein MAPG_10925 [Magnaporthiopsis poae ATCC 64411]|uniref:AAA+ ATPase domain-containing protein n=1 Tax=Magnaporthiopsis poae (strain ATCC 64411 / 73-15) TaxID=644358 RepID=A0A0C4EDW5_MAGP6|nr:hypothetical protein MAPG_10925 [Magnaporthiopsis poae ATCC 64411]